MELHFSVAISIHINFGTAEILKIQKVVALKHVLDTYKTSGFTVHTSLGYVKFDSLQNGLAFVSKSVTVQKSKSLILR